ncbi:NADH dehydrogenase subunit N [Parvularcula bermudensis HTCC2503]|uniref:NADH-quinone oxidoreductase subunit N n=1 Tax=Parvularcula bermudensis (strain ATCC BAA-594 / HTCC2503 / KCTC 12087) TaxID=314260 RepID=E0TDV5_PARBH|nr:NADH-quinone oxidoreductase subunit NuoN [Parvularcula bermudensis]ADM10404.1 NADH dehydrogenase subunit N [Parvularcula bermudensis HTCC2503]
MLIEDLTALGPELLLALASMALLVFGVSVKSDPVRPVLYGAILALVGAFFLAWFGAADRATAFGGSFSLDGLAKAGRALVYIGAIVSLFLSVRYFEIERLARFEYPILVLLSVVGMGIMVTANDLLVVYMGIELQSLALYVMAAFNRDSVRSTEAGLKYFVLGALSSGLLLYGISLIYGFTGEIRLDAIAAEIAAGEDRVAVTFGLIFLLSGLAFKVSAAPFHMWTPDVYEGAPTPVTAFFAAAPKVAGMIVFIRVMIEGFGTIVADWQPVLWIIAVLSMGIGSISALMQTNIKRLMAYSSIGHIGYALIGLTAGTEAGVTGVVVYLGIYLLMTLGTFACILAMRRPEGMAENISDLSGLSQSQPGLALAFTALFLSLAGIPPFLGFFAKFAVFTAGVEAGLYLLTVIGVVASVISTFYYLSVIKTIWFSAGSDVFVSERGTAVSVTATGVALLMTIGLLFLLPPLYRLADAAAAPLFSG